MITGTLHDVTGKWDVRFWNNAIFKLHNVGGGVQAFMFVFCWT